VTAVGSAGGAPAAAAALACAGDGLEEAGLLIRLDGSRAPRAGLFATEAARQLEERLASHLPGVGVASRGRLCVLGLGAGALEDLPAALAVGRELVTVVDVPPPIFHLALDASRGGAGAVLLRADLRGDRAVTALAAADLLRRGLRVAVMKRPLGWLAARCSLAGVPLSGALPPRLPRRLGLGEGHEQSR
jgi:hypothetical protein